MKKNKKAKATPKDKGKSFISGSEKDSDFLQQVEEKLITGTGQLPQSEQPPTPLIHFNENLAIFKQLIGASSLGYGFTDLDGNIIYVNATLSRILGLANPEDGVGTNVETYYPKDIRSELLKIILPTVMNEGQWVGELPLLSIDDKGTPTNQHIILIRDDKGNPLCLSYAITSLTDQKRVEETLRESQAMLQSILDSSPLATTVSDLTGHVIDCNFAALQLYGFKTKTDLIGIDTIEFIAPEYQEKVVTTLGQLTAGKDVVSTECTIIAQDGQRRSVEISASAIPGPSGEPVAFIGMGKDITERKQAEEELTDERKAELQAINENLEEEIAEREQVEQELQQRELYFRSLIEHSSDAIVIMDDQGGLVYQSPSFERVMGFEPGDPDVKSPLETVHPEDFDRSMQTFMDIAQNPGAIVRHETRALHRDGSWLDLEIVSHNLLENPAVGGIVSNLRDITERKRVEEETKRLYAELQEINAQLEEEITERKRIEEETKGLYADLQENNAQLEEEICERTRIEEALLQEKDFSEAIVNSLPGVFFLFDDKGRFVRWNGEVEKVTGYSSEEISQMCPIDFFSEAEQQIVAEAVLEAFEKGESSIEVNLLNKSGQLTPYYFTGACFFVNGMPHIVGVGIDITDRNQAEEMLRDRERKMSSILETSPDIIINIDRDERILFINRTYGLPEEAVIGHHVLEFVSPQYHQIHREAFDQVLETGETTSFESLAIGTDHELTTWYETRVAPVMSGDEVSAVLILTTDITDRKRAEEERTRAMAERAAIIEAMDDALFVMDMDGTGISVNPALERLYGYTESDFIGKNAFDLVSKMVKPDDLESIMTAVASSMEGKICAPDVFYFIDKNGREVPTMFSMSFVKDENGNPAQIVVTYKDITEIKRAEEALRESEQKFRMIFENANDNIAYIDLNGTILDINRKSQDIFGFTPEEIIGENVINLDIVDSETMSKFSAFMETFTVNKPGNISELSVKRKDGRKVHIDVSPSLIEKNGDVEGILAIMRDITERKEAERELSQKTQALERSNAELENFAYVASHDLQEPLRKIRAFGDRLVKVYETDDKEKGRDYTGRMLSAAERMQKLIESLLAFSRVKSRQQPFVPVDLNEVAQDVASDLYSRTKQLGASVEISELPMVSADPIQMYQVLQNLIGNALKYHRDEEPPIVKVYSQVSDGLCQIFVEDNGIGFDEKYVGRIFTIFQRLHGRLEYEGTGIGLAIARKIVELHDGSITATSTPGKGSTFIITMPTVKR